MATQDTLTALQFNIQQPETSPARLLIPDSDRVLIGSGAHCEIRLPQDQAAQEHVLVTMMGGFVYAEARSANPPPLLNGSPFSEAPLKPDSILKIGNSEITISIVEVADQMDAAAGAKQKTNPLILIMGIVLIPIGVFFVFNRSPGTGVGPKPNEVPELWVEDVSCPQSAADQARGHAEKTEIAAMGRRERSPFDVKDAVQAVPLFFEAGDCYRKAGDENLARQMDQSAETLKARVEEDYRARQMRLEHALEIEDLRTAHQEVKKLLAMLSGQTGPYVQWLSNMERRLKLETGEKKKK